jgi:hypothetical protein
MYMHGPSWLAVLALCCAVQAADALSAARAPADPVRLQLDRLDRLPLAFTERCDAAAGRPEFQVRGLGYAARLAPDVARLAVLRGDAPLHDGLRAQHRPMDVVGIRFLGADPDAPGEGLDRRAGHFHTFATGRRGNCTDVASYGRVRFARVYPGIDVEYHGQEGELEFDFSVDAGADPSCVRIAIDGADRAAIDAQGNLVLDVRGSQLTVRRPLAWQERDGRRQPVPVRFALEAGQVATLALGDYDRGLALTIDPVLAYATYLGGTKTDYATAVAVDDRGNAYVAGYTTSTDFPIRSAYDGTLADGDVEAFVLKLNAGKTLVYATFLGGAGGIDRALGIAIDAAGNAFVTGTTTGGFPATPGAYQTTATGSDSFVAKLGPAGNALIYASYVQGVEARGIAVDTSGNAYVTGRVIAAITPTAAAYQRTPGGAFVLKLDPTGATAIYSTYLGRGGAEGATGIAVDALGNAYVAGGTDSASFPVVNALQPRHAGMRDGFIAKLDPTGSTLVYSTYLGGALDDVVNAIAVDDEGAAYVAGETYSGNFPVANAFTADKPGSRLPNAALGSAFVAKIAPSGSTLAYASFLGGEVCTSACAYAAPPSPVPGDAAYGIAVDAAGHAFVAGLARSYTFPLVNSLQPAKTRDGDDSAFIVKIGRDGGALLYSTLLRTGPAGASTKLTTGAPPGSATAVAVDGAGAVYVAGDVDETSSFKPTTGAFQTKNGGGQGAMLVKLAAPVGMLALASSASVLTVGTAVTLTATVSGASLSGSVLFVDGPTILGTAPLKSSKATLTRALDVGIHRVSAVFQGAGKELDSAPVVVVVDNAAVCH